MHPYLGTENVSNHNSIESTYFNNVNSTRNILGGILNILSEQEMNMRTLIINNSMNQHQAISRNNNSRSNTQHNRDSNTQSTFGVNGFSRNNNLPPPPPTPALQRNRFRNHYERNLFNRRQNHTERHRINENIDGTREGNRANSLETIFSNLFNPGTNVLQFDFLSPVNVSPTQEQISNASRRVRFRDISQPVNRVCPISQENFNPSDEVIQINHCRHNFTPDHFNTWFSRNVRCPICRHDIRNITDMSYNNTTANIDTNTNTNTGTNEHSTADVTANNSTSIDNNGEGNRTQEERNTDAEFEAFQNSVEFNVNTPESLENMISLLTNSLALDASSNITVQYRVVDERNNERRENNNENNDNSSSGSSTNSDSDGVQ